MLQSPFQVSNQAPSFFSFSRKYSSSSSTFLYGTSHAIINNKVRAHHEKAEKSSGRKGRRTGRICCSVSRESKTAVEDQLDSSPVMVKGVVNVLMSTGDNLTNIGITRPLDDIQDLLGKSLLVEIFSSHLDPQTGKEKGVIAAYAHRQSKEGDVVKYECSFTMPKNFGIGGVLVTNEHHKETFLRDIVLSPLDDSKPVNISCMSWVHSKFNCPRDEAFSEVKQLTFSVKTLRSALKALVPSIETAIIDTKLGFPYFTAIDSLFDEGMPLPTQEGLNFFRTLVPRLIKAVQDTTDMLLFETPEMIDRDKFSWFRDEELGRQTLAGLNPLGIQLVTEFPFVSKLDPEVYGPPESAITKEVIECELGGRMTVEEAIKQKRLFIIDYHDLLLPYVHKVRELENTTLYGSRTLFFFTRRNTLKPIAIELTRPASPTKPQWKQVFSPHNWDATGAWLWKLAKIHAGAHDSGVHQLVSHWLRTHACTETYVIAANRQLSAMHPIYRLLHPHFRYTMEINALAREFLISGGGIIETSFSPGKYSMELCSVAYDKLWRFDTESLPGDLISRGMAVEDPNAEHGLKLTIEDYPYAADGLLVWSSIKEWVTDYVCHYYPRPELVKKDQELQAWWTEVRVKGHPEKKDEPWWPKLETEEDLIGILCTIIWVASGHHAAVNFGQYHYAGYFPNRPTIARMRMPVEALEDGDSEEFEKFFEKPETAMMKCFPSQIQATVVMSILDILSSHAPDEEYLGGELEASWAENLEIKAAFERFNGRMKVIEGIVDGRNANHELRNRCGAGIVPYELLKPFSEPGVTGMGIPNSISI